MTYVWRPIEHESYDDDRVMCDHCDEPIPYLDDVKRLPGCSSQTFGCEVCPTCFENATAVDDAED